MRIASVVGVGLLVVLELFQVALAAGAPLGRAAWGGTHEGVLPTRLRVASGVNALFIYPVIALVFLEAGGLVDVAWLPGAAPVVLWVLTAFFALGAFANLASRSNVERLWSPVALALAVCSGVLAASS